MFEELPSLCPVQFFGITADCLHLSKGKVKKKKNHRLPQTSELLDEERFAEVYAAWNFEKLLFEVEVQVPFTGVDEGDPRKGDSIEFFIDTRDLKSKATLSRFCHHFIFYPALIQGFYGREITRFPTDDTHRLCHPEDLIIQPQVEKNGYRLEIEIPAACLTGFDPLNFPRIGFTYRINRSGGASQHFAGSSEEYSIERHPASWGTLKLIKQDE